MKRNYVGIDVSAKTFALLIDHEGIRTEAFDLDNDAKGHRALIKMITKKGRHTRVVLEATGVYSLILFCGGAANPANYACSTGRLPMEPTTTQPWPSSRPAAWWP